MSTYMICDDFDVDSGGSASVDIVAGSNNLTSGRGRCRRRLAVRLEPLVPLDVRDLKWEVEVWLRLEVPCTALSTTELNFKSVVLWPIIKTFYERNLHLSCTVVGNFPVNLTLES